MATIIYLIEIALWIVLIVWSWNSLTNIKEKNIKIKYIVINLIILTIITTIIFNISSSGVQYPNKNMIAPVRRIIEFLFIPLNGFIVMPYLAIQIGNLNSEQIDDKIFKKRITVMTIIFIVILIIEIFYFKDIQNGILNLYKK